MNFKLATKHAQWLLLVHRALCTESCPDSVYIEILDVTLEEAFP
jgi:hypothetical protein